MANKANYFLSKVLGEDFFESLAKTELWKPGTRTTTDHEEIKTGLHIVPRAVMSFLFRELIPMQVGESKEVSIPVGPDAILRVIKHERDVYTGDISENNKVVVDFKYRSVPGIGLVIMSAFELYDVDQLKVPEKTSPGNPGYSDDFAARVQSAIDERMQLANLVERVVEQKLAHKDAVQQLILARITDRLHAAPPAPEMPVEKVIATMEKSKKGSPLKAFLDRKKPKEFSVHMAKGENVNCPDCQKNIFDGKLFSGCICLGDDRDRKLFIKKTEDGIKVRFSKGWDTENIEMLLEVLRKKK